MVNHTGKSSRVDRRGLGRHAVHHRLLPRDVHHVRDDPNAIPFTLAYGAGMVDAAAAVK